MRLSTRSALIGLLLLVAIGGIFSALGGSETTSAPLEASPESSGVETNWVEGPCKKAGVTVVVDFGTDSKMLPLVRCAAEFTGTGWDALVATEMQAEGTKQYPTGFVCRISGYPDIADQNCMDTPTYAEGSWSYFLKNATSQEWQVSGLGSATRKPKCGEVEAWRFLLPGESALDFQPSINAESFSCEEN